METRRGGGEVSRQSARVSHGAVKVHLPPLPASEARKGRGEGQRVLSRLAETDGTRPEEGEARSWKDVLRKRSWRKQVRVLQRGCEREESGAQCCADVCGELEKPARERERESGD